MHRQKIFIAIIFFVIILIFGEFGGSALLNFILETHSNNDLNSQNKMVQFEIDNTLHVPKRLPIYLPEFKKIDIQMAYSYAKIFSVARNFSESNDFYSFENENGMLTASKNRGYIIFTNYNKNSHTVVQKEDVVEIATKYFQNKFLLFNYSEAKIIQDNDQFKVEFINSLNGIKNYSFPDIITLDEKGNVLSLEYNDVSFKKFNTCKLIDFREACNKLIAQLGNLKKTDVSNCELIYIYQDSIIQPAYLFEITQDNQKFSRIIKALAYS